MSRRRSWATPKSSWSEVFKKGYTAGIRRALRHIDEEHRSPKPVDLSRIKSIDRAACRAVEHRHCGNDNSILNGYRAPY